MLKAGDCYLIATNTDERGYEVLHLHVVLLNGEFHTQNSIIVQINTLDSPRQDRTTILRPDDHEFIIRDSYVNYGRARIRSLKDVQRNIDEKIAKPKECMREEVLSRVCDGIMKSPFTTFEVRDMYSRCLFDKIKK